MSTLNRRHAAALAIVTTSLLSWALLGACSSSNSNPQPIVYNLDAALDGNLTHKPDSSTHTSTDGSPDGKRDVALSKDVVTPPADVGLPTDGALPADALVDVHILDGSYVDASVCGSDGGCYKCTPTTNDEFLNQCTASACTPFDNTTRLPNYDGGLPPLGS
jgi:hypothetical protein